MFLSESLASHHKKFPDKSLLLEVKQLKDIVLQLKQDTSRDVREPLLVISEELLQSTIFKEEEEKIDEETESNKDERDSDVILQIILSLIDKVIDQKEGVNGLSSES